MTESRPTLYDTMHCSLPGSSDRGVLQVNVNGVDSHPFSRASVFRARDQTWVSHIAGRFFAVRAASEVFEKPLSNSVSRLLGPPTAHHCQATGSQTSEHDTEIHHGCLHSSLHSASANQIFATSHTRTTNSHFFLCTVSRKALSLHLQLSMPGPLFLVWLE